MKLRIPRRSGLGLLIAFGALSLSAADAGRILTPAEIGSCARGTCTMASNDQGVSLSRLPASTVAYLEHKNPVWGIRAHCAAGIVLDFISDSATVAVDATFVKGISAEGPIDVRVNGEFAGRLIPDSETHRLHAQLALPQAGGLREVALYLPQSCGVTLTRVALAPAAQFTPAPRRPVLLAIGDSITQGTGSPSEGYAARTARALGLTLHNAGIGGHRFDPGSLTERFEENPALITVAFGTNDWNGGASPEVARKYLARLRELWPRAPVFVLEPIYRTGRAADAEPPRKNSLGLTLPDYRRQLAAIVATFPNMMVLATDRLFPRDASLLTDGVHPNDQGNAVYAQRLTAILAQR